MEGITDEKKISDEETGYIKDADVEVVPANKLARNLKGRHMQMIAIGMLAASLALISAPDGD